MLGVASSFVLLLFLVLLGGFAMRWLIRLFTLSREPAFAAFCFTLAAALARVGVISDKGPAGPLEPLAALVGGVVGLWLFWRLAVKPERAEQTAGD